MAGDWDSPDPAGLLQLLAMNEHASGKFLSSGLLSRMTARLRHRLRANTSSGSRRNIAYHYDLGNDFYQLWLDPSMTYSAGLFADEKTTLDVAQQAKYQRLLELLAPEPEAHLLEIGCGWGGFASHAACAGHRVTGVTLSCEQLAWAHQRFAGTSACSQVTLQLCDYRDIRGQFDHIVSIEMFEAVGEAYWPDYMATLRRCLRPGGRAVLQLITIDECDFEDYKAHPDFVQTYIFPGGMLPSVERFDSAVADAGLELIERHFHAQDYARTLACWQQRFVARSADIRMLGFDERFLRMWRYYLAYCEAGFRECRINVMQLVLRKP